MKNLPKTYRGQAAFWIVLSTLVLFVPLLSIGVFVASGEDTFISIRYAEHLLQGHGLIYNPAFPDDAVEGYSNLLWVLVVSGWGTVWPNLELASRNLSVLFHALLVVLAPLYIRSGRPPADQHSRSWLALFLPLALATHPVLYDISGLGLETMLQCVLLTGSGALLVRRKYVLAGVLLAAAAANRPEGFVFWFCFLPVIIWDVWKLHQLNQKPIFKPLWLFGVVWLPLLLILFSWRWATYHQLLPNTVYAKIAARDVYPALQQSPWKFLRDTSLLPVVTTLALLAGARWRWFHGLWRETFIALLGTMSLLGFSVFVAKTPEANRYLAPAIPFMLILLQICLLGIMKTRGHAFKGVVASVALLLITGQILQPLRNWQPDARMTARLAKLLKHRPFKQRWHYWQREPVFVDTNVGHWINQNLPSDAVIGMDQCGQIAFFSKRSVIDLYSLSDRYIWRFKFDRDQILDYLDERRVTHLALLTAKPESGKPVSAEGNYGGLAQLPAFKARYTKTHVLLGAGFPWGYVIYARKSGGDAMPADSAPVDVVYLGLTQDQIQHLAWGI